MSDRLVRVMVADDDPHVRSAIVQLLTGLEEIVVVGEADDAVTAIAIAVETRPDVALIDVSMPGGGGAAAVAGIRHRSPETKLIALTAHDDRSTVMEMLRVGVSGYLVKGDAPNEIIEAVRRVAEGRGSLSSAIMSDVIAELAGELDAKRQVSDVRGARERRIKRALDDPSTLEMVFQPIVSLPDRTMVGAEALARFPRAPKRAVSLWFSEAREVGLAARLELAAARKALAGLDRLPEDAFLSINLSPETIVGRGFLELLSELGADGARIVVEVTEHAPIVDYDRIGEAVDEMRAGGLRLAIDDAGAGFASLRHILRLAPDFIKLDVGLVRDIHSDQAKRALAAGLISFALESKAAVVGEGIEKAEEARTLEGLGAQLAQGYYFGRPGSLPPNQAPGDSGRQG